MTTRSNFVRSTGQTASRLRLHWRRRGNGLPLFRALTEKYSPHLRVSRVDRGGRLDANGEGALDRVARTNGFEPAPKVRKLPKLLPGALGETHPADTGHVGDGVTA